MPPSYNVIGSHFVDTSSTAGIPSYKLELSQYDPRKTISDTQKRYDQQQMVYGEQVSRKEEDVRGGFEIPHVATFAYRYNQHMKAYWWEFDEALKYGHRTSLSMRTDCFIHELIRHRQLPVASLPMFVEPDNPDDEDQKEVAKDLEKLILATPKFQTLKLCLLEAIFFGKAGVNVKWGKVKLSGNERVVIKGFYPVEGDKIRHKWNGTPGILIRDDDDFIKPEYQKDVGWLDLAKVLWLKNEYLRDCYIIHEFEPSDTDYLFEGDMAQAVHGIGLRSRLFWAWNMRSELLCWYLDALQRVGVNGMMFGFHKTGDPSSQNAMIKALQDLVNNNIASFETDFNSGNMKDIIQHIDPSRVGYENLYQLITHMEEIMRATVLGQSLSSQATATGMGSKTAELQGDVYDSYIRYDGMSLAETLDTDMKRPLLKFNIFKYKGKKYRGDDLPFEMKVKVKIDEKSATERLQNAQMLAGLNVVLDSKQLLDIAGLNPPKSAATAVPPQAVAMQQQLIQGMQGGGQPGGQPGEQPGQAPPPGGQQGPEQTMSDMGAQ